MYNFEKNAQLIHSLLKFCCLQVVRTNSIESETKNKPKLFDLNLNLSEVYKMRVDCRG